MSERISDELPARPKWADELVRLGGQLQLESSAMLACGAEMVREYGELRARIKALEAERNALRNALHISLGGDPDDR